MIIDHPGRLHEEFEQQAVIVYRITPLRVVIMDFAIIDFSPRAAFVSFPAHLFQSVNASVNPVTPGSPS